MKPVMAGFCMALLAVLAWGQDRLSQEEAQRYAKVCVEQAGSLSDAQIETDVGPEKAMAVRGEGGGAMTIPDKKLSKDKPIKPDQEVVPVGQLWLRKWTVVVGGKAVARDRLRVVTINVDDKDRPMLLFLLGVRKKAKKDLELVAYGKDSEPILAVPLKKVDFIQDLPMEMVWQRGEKEADSLTVTILGKYQAVLPVTRE